MSNAVVIAGGRWQAPIVKYLQSKDYKVYVVNPDVTETTKLADGHIQLNILDLVEVGRRITPLSPVIITSDQSDVAVMPVAVLTSAFKLRGNSLESCALFTDKLKMAAFAADHGALIPAYDCVRTPEDIENFCNVFSGPHVLKPIDANASRGFVYLDKYDNLSGKLSYALSHSRTDCAMIQNYIHGTGVILDGICSGKKHRTLAIARKSYFREGVISRVEYPATLSRDVIGRLIDVNDRLVESSGLSFGITHAEYIVDGGGRVWLLEIAARGGGFKISSDIIPWVTSINVYDVLYGDLCGYSTGVKGLSVINKKSAVIKFYEYQSGVVKDIVGVEDVQKIPGVNEFRMMINVGDQITPAKDGGTRHAVAVILGKNDEEIKKIEDTIDQKVKVVVE